MGPSPNSKGVNNLRMQSSNVVVGYHHWGQVDGIFAWCLARAVAHEGGRIRYVIQLASPYTDEARNKLVEEFLADPSKPEFFLMVDGDIEFEKDAISRTMFIADAYDAQVVWGNYMLGGMTNSLFMRDPTGETDLACAMTDLKPGTVYGGIYGGGTGWCLMRRGLLEKMRDVYGDPWPWFGRDDLEDKQGKIIKMGEDLTFGRRVWYLGETQVGYTGLKLLHRKTNPMCPPFMADEVGGDGRLVINNAFIPRSAQTTTAGRPADPPPTATTESQGDQDHGGDIRSEEETVPR